VKDLIILVLAGSCIWLYLERSRLDDRIVALNTEVTSLDNRIEQARNAKASGGAASPWLQNHLQEGAGVLSRPAKPVRQ
jgi:hypothetical protein